MAPIKFSIVIPTFNRQDLILDTLATVFAQSYQNFEVLVVDNCSTDRTIDILRPLESEGKIRLIRNERNYERAYSRNVGMSHAKGDFLTFLDSDDYLYTDCLADALAFIQTNPDRKCFHCLYELVDGSGATIRKFSYPSLDDPIKAIVSGNFMSCIGNFIHRDIYSIYRFDTFSDLTGAEDWEFWLRVIGDFGVGRIAKVNCGILHHEGRTVQSKHFEKLENGYRHLFENFENDTRLRSIYGRHMRRIRASSYLYLAILANSGGFFADSRRYLKAAFQSDPSILFGTRFFRVARRTVFRIQSKD